MRGSFEMKAVRKRVVFALGFCEKPSFRDVGPPVRVNRQPTMERV
ncbi:hypothetical protein BSY16_5664 (plasmid) [Sinorhizobium sp. RAC02]|nr:hypothetical protein BSY16_5664 [Sinorhizobium sp. RAC02]